MSRTTINSFTIIIVLTLGSINSVASSDDICRNLNSTLFEKCIAEGINSSSSVNSPGSNSREIAGFLTNMIRTFEKCSPAHANLMACSVYVPKCVEGGDAILPCRKVCEKFVADCNGQDGVDVIQKLCPLLQAEKGGGSCLKTRAFNGNYTGKST